MFGDFEHDKEAVRNALAELGLTRDGNRPVKKGYALKDSGERQEFSTGSRRDTREGKGRYDLIPWEVVQRLAIVFEKGAAKYGDRNWEKGQPLSRYLDSAIRHIINWQQGLDDEDHLVQAVWNLVALAWTEHHVELGDLPESLADAGPTKVE